MSSEPKKSLEETEISSERTVGRRSALGVLGAGVIGGAVAVTGMVSQPQVAQAKATDSDAGANADGAGRGRTGQTDRDSGSGSDIAGHGVCAERGHTDSDSGGNADGAARGRGPCR